MGEEYCLCMRETCYILCGFFLRLAVDSMLCDNSVLTETVRYILYAAFSISFTCNCIFIVVKIAGVFEITKTMSFRLQVTKYTKNYEN